MPFTHDPIAPTVCRPQPAAFACALSDGSLSVLLCGMVAPVTRHTLLELPRCSRLALHPGHRKLLHMCTVQDNRAPGAMFASDPAEARARNCCCSYRRIWY